MGSDLLLSLWQRNMCRNTPVHCDSSGYHFDLSVSVCVCLSPRLDFGRKKKYGRIYYSKRILGCLGLHFAGPELKPRWGTALLSSLPTEQTEPAEIVSLSTKKQSSSLQQKRAKQHRDFQDYHSSPAVFKLVQILCCSHTRAHVLLRRATCARLARQGFTGNRGSSSSFEGQPSQS